MSISFNKIGGSHNIFVTGTRSPTLISGVGISFNFFVSGFQINKDLLSVTITLLPPFVLISYNSLPGSCLVIAVTSPHVTFPFSSVVGMNTSPSFIFNNSICLSVKC